MDYCKEQKKTVEGVWDEYCNLLRGHEESHAYVGFQWWQENNGGLYNHPPADDPVNHPKHYTSDPSGIECITITRHRNFNIGNAMKYLWRAGLKDSDADTQDMEKAIWYIQDEIQRLKESK